METYKLSRDSARRMARYLATYHHKADADAASEVAAALWSLVDAEYEGVVLVDDERAES